VVLGHLALVDAAPAFFLLIGLRWILLEQSF
jgi:hypothetical protein